MASRVAPPVPNRNALENMKRVDLQRLCKDYGVRANLKSEELIELLLETRKPNIRSVQPVVRSVATRRASRSAGRVSSMIIHDEDGASSNQESIVNANENQTGPPASQASTSHPPRTRSSKYAPQTRLGVGRPGNPRTVTKSLSLSKRRWKGSRSVNPKETTIVEEPEPEIEPEEPVAEGSGSIHAVTSHNTPSQPEAPSPVMSRPASSQPARSLDDRIAEVIAPLQRQLQTMKEDLEQMNALKAELDRLKTEVATIGPLKESVASLTSEVKALRSQTSTGQLLIHGSSTVVDQPSRQYTPGAAPTLLGKRSRESTGSEDSDVMENDEEDSTVHQGIIPPDRKRQRLDDAHADFPKTPPNHPQSLPPHIQPDDVIRGGPLGTPPPLDRLPELYGTPSSPPERKRDNGHPFNFTFTVPVPPTPDPAFTMPFAYPEPPQSPTPAQHPRSRLLGPPRADIFQAIRRASMERSRQSESNAESSQGLGTFLNEAALGADSDQAGNNTLLSDLDVLDPEGGSPSKRTMYGTEIETDHRFGDFGFEGVNPSYWAPRF